MSSPGRAGCSIHLQDTACTSSSRRSNLASSLGTTLSSTSASQRFTPMAIVRHMRSMSSVFLVAMLNALTEAEKMEFRPLVQDIGFRRPLPDDPCARKPKPDEADYADKLKGHNAFLMERDAYREIQYVRDDFTLLTSVVAEAYGPNFFSYITRNAMDHEMRNKYRTMWAEGYPLYDSTLRERFNASYILACLEKTLQSTEGQGKDFKSSFARKAKSDLLAYERLSEKREAELEELYTRPFEDIAVEEFLDQLPKPQIEEIVEPEPMDTSGAPKENADTPMDTSDVKAGTGDLPQGEMPDTEAPDVPMQADAPESSPQKAVSGVTAEPAEGSPQGEESETKDEHMGATEEANDDKAATSAEEKNEKAFEKMENANDNKGLEHTEEFQYFCEVIFSEEEKRSPMRKLIEHKGRYSTSGVFTTLVFETNLSALSRSNIWPGVSMWVRIQ